MEQFDIDPFIANGLHLKQLTGHSSVDGTFAITGSLRHLDSVNVDANITRASFDYDLVHGRVQTISNPQITFVSGSSAQFTVGGQTNYISSIGQLVTASNISGTTTGSNSNGVGTNCG